MNRLTFLALTLAIGLLVGCGGGGGGGTATNGTTLSISGIAATGAAISGGTIEVKCKSGTGSATSGADGTYAISISNGQQPCMLRATDPVTKLELHSMVEEGATTANITPVTDLVVANTLGTTPATAFSGFSDVVHQKITAANMAAAITKVQAATAALGPDADMSGIDPMKASMRAATNDSAGDATDQKIDALMSALAAADKKISDLSALLKSSATSNAAATQLTALVGNAQYSLANCPAARSGDIWVMDFQGLPPQAFNINFNTMVLKNLSDNTASAIDFKRDAQNNAIPCAFTSVVGGLLNEFRVSDSGLSVWKNSLDFGIAVPKQSINDLNSPTFAGSYPSFMYVMNKQTGVNAAVPFRFEVDATGKLDGYSCDLTKSTPDCLTPSPSSSSSKTTCTPQLNGTLICTDGKMQATAVSFVSGGSATLFMAITNFPYNAWTSLGGLMVMTKAAPMQLPTAGTQTAAGAAWYAGVNASNVLVSGDTPASKVESVDAATRSYTTSMSGSTGTYTRYQNTPATGMLFTKSSTGASGIGIGSSAAGWSFAIAKSTSTSSVYDEWYAYVRSKR